jgi:DnaJ-domain-containing protein 1
MNLPGRLRTTTLGDLLGMLHRAEASGTLELAEDAGRAHRIYLSRGLVVAVEIDGATPTLSEVLKREYSVEDDLLRRSLLRAMSSERLHGDVLVQDFRIDKRTVNEALRRQLTARLERLERLMDARVLFRVALRAPRGAMTESPLPAIRFLAGKRRARDAVGKTPLPGRARNPRATEDPFRRDEHRAVALRVLGVSSAADDTEIRRAYRKLVRAFHPDAHPSASDAERRSLSQRFQAVTEAYRALVA